jgi:aspartate-semialdehyde dehydrogenase
VATVSLVGSDTQLGREVRDGLTKAGLRASVQLIGVSDESSALEPGPEGEATVISAMEETRLRASDLIVSATDAAGTAKAWGYVSDGGPTLIDLWGSLEPEPSARLRSPLTEPNGQVSGKSNLLVLAHPASVVLALLLHRLHRSFPLRQSVIQVFEPASGRGTAGLLELQQQVASLLSFRPMEKRIFDAQLGFNMLPQYGEDAPEALAEVEARVYRHLATQLAGAVPMPSLRVVQAPVFHGHSFSIWAEFESRPSAQQLGEAIASAQIEVRGSDVEPPTNVGVAGQSGVSVGMIEPDRSHPRAVWLWAAADNYQITADGAVSLVRSLLGESGA